MGLGREKKRKRFTHIRLDWGWVERKKKKKSLHTLDYIRKLSCSNAMHGKLGLLSPGEIEQPYYGATQLFYFIFLLCAVFPCFHTTGCEAYSFTTDGYGIFLTCAPIFVHACAHTKAGQALMSALTRVDSEELKNGPSHPASTGD